MSHTPYHIRKRLKEIISPETVNVSDVSKLKPGLSGKIWQKDGKIKPEVREKMIAIAKKFYEYLGLEYPIVDIYFTGSLANYNWTNHSDADIHIMFDMGAEDEDELLSEFIFAKKDLWATKHDIKLYGFPVELFAKNMEEQHESKAIYSLVKNDWIKKPSKKNVHIDAEAIKIKAAELMNKIDDIEKISDEDNKLSKADKLKEKIKNMRGAALEQGGEYSTENLVFKTLRNNGYLEKLNNIKTSTFDKQMSLNESKSKDHKYEYGCLMLGVNIPNWKKITDQIKPEDLYNEPGFGIEDDPHVTALFGFHDNEVSLDDIKKFTKKIVNRPLPIKLTGISLFETKDKPYDVIKFDVKSNELTRLNKWLRRLPHTSAFKEYHPHMTIAYVKKGLGQKYISQFAEPLNVIGDKLIYSHPDKTKDVWSVIKRNTLKVQKGIPGMTEDKIKILKDFVYFTCCKLKIEEPVTVVIRNGRDEYITTTASYLPHENENHIRAGGRALVDICRSIGHELTHNRQRELGIFNPGDNVQNIGGKIEDEANSIAGILIKDFTHNYGYDSIYEI